MKDDIKRIAGYCNQALNLKEARLNPEYFYQSLPLCIVEAVFSLGVRYEGTRRTVIRYCDYFNLQRWKVLTKRKALQPKYDGSIIGGLARLSLTPVIVKKLLGTPVPINNLI